VPINALVPIRGTVLGDMLADTPLGRIDDIEFVRTVARARIAMPRSMVRLSAGRESMSESTQALCFMAGANSIFTGRQIAHHRQCRGAGRCGAVRKAGPVGYGSGSAPADGGRARGNDVISLILAGLLLSAQEPDCSDPQTQAE
jgi:hypothetical protein